MVEKKKKDKEEPPKLVEVYGDDVVKKDKGKDEKEKSTKEKVSLVDNKQEGNNKDKGKTPEEIVEEIIEERQAFKTEVVDQEEKETKEKDLDEKKKKEEFSEKIKDDTTPQKTQDETAFEDEIGSQRSAVKGVFGVGLFVFLIIFGLTGWAFYLKSVWLPKETVSEVVTEASPIPNTTPEPEKIVELLTREEISLDVLNGSGVSGLAGKTATTFEELGYEIGEIGNADDVETTELYIQEDLEEQLGNLLDDVKEELGVASVSGYLDSDVESMGKIVLGN